MSVEIRVPTLGESVTEATIAKWLKNAGDAVQVDEPVVELETDKVSLEVPSPTAGILAEILAEAGSDVSVGALIGRIEAGGAAVAPSAKEEAKEQALGEGSGPPSPLSAPARAIEKAETAAADATAQAGPAADGAAQAGPAARKLAAEKGIDLASVPATGPKGNVTKGDVVTALADARLSRGRVPAPAPASPRSRRTARRQHGPRAARSGSR